jgi:hypothetical protein
LASGAADGWPRAGLTDGGEGTLAEGCWAKAADVQHVKITSGTSGREKDRVNIPVFLA